MAGFGCGKRKHCRAKKVAQLVREKSVLLIRLARLLIGDRVVSLLAEFGDCVGDGIVQAAIERSKLVYLKRGVTLECEVRNRLAQVAVVMDDLVNRKSEFE